MPKKRTVLVYSFNELNESAKENARNWWRCNIDSNDFDFIIEDAERAAKIIGIEFDTRDVKLMGGGTRQDSKIWWSGFASQGDGACFEGRYSYRKGAAKAIRHYAPKDATLHQIADDLQAAQRPAFYRASAVCSHQDRYYHSGCMAVRVDDSPSLEISEQIAQALRDFADWIYSQLDKENDWLNSDEQVDESILANDYEFNEDGTIA